MPLVVGMRYYRLWVGGGGGTASTSPRNAANLSRFLLVGHWEGWRRALHWQAGEDTCLLPASPPGSTVPHWHQ